MDLPISLQLLRDIISPSRNQEGTAAKLSLSYIVEQNLKNFNEKHQDYYGNLKLDTEKDIIWKFCQLITHVLVDLNNSKFELNDNNCYLSIQDERNLLSLCEFFICFGVHYNLDDNIGLPIEKLSKYGFLLKETKVNVSPVERNKRLNWLLDNLYSLKQTKREHVNIINIFYSKYLHDILCALLQLCYSPNSVCDDKERYLKWLEVDLFNDIDGSVLVRCLIMLQGANRLQCPKWFLVKTGDFLTKCVLQPNSVINVIKAILDEIDDKYTLYVIYGRYLNLSNYIGMSKTQAHDWKKCDLVAQILSKCPRSMSIENYIKFISPQIVKLFLNQNENVSKYLSRVISTIYAHFSNKYPDLTQAHITRQIIKPFGKKRVKPEELNKTINFIHLVFISSTDPNWTTLKQLDVQFLHFIFQLYIFTKTKVLCKNIHLKCQDILQTYISLTPEPIQFISGLLRCSVIDDQQFECFYCKNNGLIQIESPLENDSVRLMYDNEVKHEAALTIDEIEKRCEAICLVLKDANLKIEFLFYLFENLNLTIDATNGQAESAKGTTDKCLLDFENKINNLENRLNLKILYFTQLSHLFECVDVELLLKNYEKIIEFCNLLLKTLIDLHADQSLNADTKSVEQNDILFLVLSIITVFTSDFLVKIEYNVKIKLQVLLPNLTKLAEYYDGEQSVGELLDELIVSVSTYCAVQTSESKVKTKKPLIEEVEPEHEVITFGKALKEISDPLIPIRGHGLILLRKLIECKDEECLGSFNKILDILMDNIRNDDSYIYQTAINALIALAVVDSQRVLKILLNEYANSKLLNSDNRVKIGEVLTKYVRNLADLVPYHGDTLLSIFLNGTKSEDEFLRSSSLSNLGETCKLMKYSIKNNINEIMQCLTSIIDTDKSMQVKRSAILVLKLLFESLDKENFLDILSDSILNLYRILKKCLITIDDDVFKLHAQIAYEYLDELMKGYLFPKQKLQKEIKILNF